MKQRITSYLSAHALQLFVAVAIIGALAAGIIDPASAAIGGIILDTSGDVMAQAKEALGHIKSQVDAFCKAQKERTGEIDQKTLELQARLSELEMKAARRGSGGDPGGDFGDRGEDLGALVLKAEHLDALRGGELKNLRIPVGTFPRAALTSGGYPGISERDMEIYGALPSRLTVQDLIPSRPTTLGAIEFVQSATTGAAAVQLSTDSPPLTDGATKAELTITAELKTAKVVTVAAWTAASRQVLDDNDSLKDFVNGTLLDAVALATEAQILLGSGLTGNLSGLLTEATAYSRHVSGDTWADDLRRACTQVQIARGVPTGIVISPAGLEHIELEKDQQDRYVMAIEVKDANGRAVVWRVPTVVSDAIADDVFLVADFQRATRIFDRQQAMIAISLDHSDFFVRNLVAILGERRLALTVPRPALLVTGTFGQT